MAAQLHFVLDLGVMEFPGVVIFQPLVGDLHLPAVPDLLVENAELVAQPVADGRDAKRRQGVKVTGRQPPQAAVPQPRLFLLVQQAHETPVELGHRLFHLFINPQVDEVVPQVGARQVFRRKVAHHLHFLADEARHGVHQVMQQALPDGVGQGHVEVMGGGDAGGLPQQVEEILLDRPFQGLVTQTGAGGFQDFSPSVQPICTHVLFLPLLTTHSVISPRSATGPSVS